MRAEYLGPPLLVIVFGCQMKGYIPPPQAPIYQALHPCLTPSFVLTLTHQDR
jgi:hypothetical protein